MEYATLEQAIDANIIPFNNAQLITGEKLNIVLHSMVEELGQGYQYMGLVSPSSPAITTDGKVFVVASTAGTYANYGGLTIAEGEVAILKYGTSWTKEHITYGMTSALREKLVALPTAEKLNEMVADMYELVTIEHGSSKSMIPTSNGSLISGGSRFKAFDFDVTDINRTIQIVSDALTPQSGQFPTAVTWALYSGSASADNFLANGALLHSDTRVEEVDLSQYPTAKILRVSTESATLGSSVSYMVKKLATNERVDSIDDRVTALEQSTPHTEIRVVLPPIFHVVKGERVQMFYRGMVEAVNPYHYAINPVCSVGKAYPRYLHFEGASANVEQTLPMSLKVVDSNDNIVGQAESVIKVINPMSNPSTMKNVLIFGASTLGTGSITKELKRRLCETSGTAGDRSNPKGLGLTNINFVGRKVGSVYDDVHQEATGGWSWLDYTTEGRAAVRFQVSGVTQLNMGDTYTDGSHTFTIAEINVTSGVGNIRCLGASTASSASGTLTKVSGSGDSTIVYSSFSSEHYSPFFSNGQIDFTQYANDYCGGHIDVLISFCGTNDIFGNRTMEQVFENSIKPFARKYHQQSPNGKFILSTIQLPDMKGGMGASYGAHESSNYWKMSRRYFEFARLAYEMANLTEFGGFMSIANCLQYVDAENCYQYTEAPVGNRYPDIKETLGLNGVHPSGASSSGGAITGGSEAGTKSIADAIYQTFNALVL